MNIQLFMTKIVVCNTADQQKYIRMRVASRKRPQEGWDGGELPVKNRTHVQGWRHGFESGGRQILRAKRAENFLNPPLFGQWVDKIRR